MKSFGWQFSLRTSFLLTAIAACAVAFAANYPAAAAAIAGVILLFMIQTGLLFSIIQLLLTPSTYARIPLLGAIVGALFGIVFLMLVGIFVWMTTQVDGGLIGVCGILIPGAFFAILYVHCCRLIWNCLTGRNGSTLDQPPANRRQ